MRIATVFVLASLLIGCNDQTVDEITSLRVPEELLIDGDGSDWPVKSSILYVYDREIDQGGKKRVLSDNRIGCRSLWTDKYLYLLFEVQDKHLNASQTDHDHAKLYLDDMVEFLIDPDKDATALWLPDDLIYHINILGTVKDDRGTLEGDRNVAWNGSAHHALGIRGTVNDDSDLDEGYRLEVAVPWEEIGRVPTEGLTMGFNFANGDHDGKGRQLFDLRSAWPMRTPNQFGIIKLVKGDV
ncbi:MAG: sugar-binding protein [Bacteroidota bacterium]